jgi:8-oxo-dGTP diphosphatase
VARIRGKLEYTTLATSFVPPQFTLAELRSVYEAVWDQRLDPSNFRRKALACDDFVVEVDAEPRPGSGPGRPAQLYRAGSAERLSIPFGR